MIIMDFVKFVHLSCVMLFVGLLVANYYMVARSMVVNNVDIFYSLSVWLDKVCLFLFVLMPLTGVFLVHPKGFFYNTPWVEAAFTFSTLTLVLLFLSMWSKKIISRDCCVLHRNFKVQLLFHVVNVVMLVVLFCIIHDAVVKATIF